MLIQNNGMAWLFLHFYGVSDLLACNNQTSQWRHDIHRHPEPVFDEHRTPEKVAALLQEWDIETHTGIGGADEILTTGADFWVSLVNL